mmetsp:Transcript_30577/g.48980  ORF Transcript_30577/g.48980 Transcript_30577/m.48980 type:complete len:914 (-) Transcript_30577:4135-6876(-)
MTDLDAGTGLEHDYDDTIDENSVVIQPPRFAGRPPALSRVTESDEALDSDEGTGQGVVQSTVKRSSSGEDEGDGLGSLYGQIDQIVDVVEVSSQDDIKLLKRSFSYNSNRAYEKLAGFDKELEAIEKTIFSDEVVPEALILFNTYKLHKLKQRLEMINGQLERLQDLGIGSVIVAELETGKEEVLEYRKRLSIRASDAIERNKEIHAQLSSILRDRKEWSTRGLLKMLVTTWNVGNTPLRKEELNSWIPAGGGNNDVIVVGLQECDYELTPEMKAAVSHGRLYKKHTRAELEKVGAASHARASSGVLSENHTTNRIGAYTLYYRLKFENGLKKTITSKVGVHVLTLLLNHLGPEYALVRDSELAQMRLFVISKKTHLHDISDVQYASEATGIGGIAANKGAVAATLRLYGLRLGWISCHLAAHKKNKYVKARNDSLRHIFRLLDKKLSSKGYNLTSELDHLWVFGDLNYRITLRAPENETNPGSNVSTYASLSEHGDIEDEDDGCEEDEEYDSDQSPEIVVDKDLNVSRPQMRGKREKHEDTEMVDWNFVSQTIFDEHWEKLFENDQLKREMKARRVLTSFQEGEYKFPPTFKVLRNHSNPVYVPTRCPSYCDRILWHSLPGRKSRMKQILLDSCHGVTSSDHKPVVSEFVLEIKQKHLRELVGAKTSSVGLYPATPTSNAYDSMNSPKGVPPSPRASALTDKKHSRFLISDKAYEPIGEGGMKLQITGLKVKDLMSRDYDGQADPYIIFCSPDLYTPKHAGYNPRRGVCQTPVLKHRLAAEWKNEDIPLIAVPPNYSTAKSMRQCHLVFALWDHDHISRDDSLGQAILGLQPIADCFEELAKLTKPELYSTFETPPKHFALPILTHGRQHGVLRGKIRLMGPEWEPDPTQEQKRSKKQIAPKNQHIGCCALQ